MVSAGGGSPVCSPFRGGALAAVTAGLRAGSSFSPEPPCAGKRSLALWAKRRPWSGHQAQAHTVPGRAGRGGGRSEASRLAVPRSVCLQGSDTLAPGRRPASSSGQARLPLLLLCCPKKTVHLARSPRTPGLRGSERRMELKSRAAAGTSLHALPPTGCARRPRQRPSSPTPSGQSPGSLSCCSVPTSRAPFPQPGFCLCQRQLPPLLSAHRPLPVLPGCSMCHPWGAPDSLGSNVWGGAGALSWAQPLPAPTLPSWG